MESITRKKCPKCGEMKKCDEFYKDSRTPTGLYGLCKSCHYKSNKKCKLNHLNEYKDKARTHARDVRHKNLEYYREKDRERYWKNVEQSRKNARNKYKPEYSHKYYLEHKDEHTVVVNKWRKKNPIKLKIYSLNRRALRNNCCEKISEQDWIHIKEKYGNKCLCCKRTDVKLTIDHVVPLSCGGENSIRNIQPLCKPCNSSKGTKIIDYRKSL